MEGFGRGVRRRRREAEKCASAALSAPLLRCWPPPHTPAPAGAARTALREDADHRVGGGGDDPAAAQVVVAAAQALGVQNHQRPHPRVAHLTDGVQHLL